MSKPTKQEPVLLKASELAESDVGLWEWDPDQTSDLISISNGGRTIDWSPREVPVVSRWRSLFSRQGSGSKKAEVHHPAWIHASTRLRLHSGRFQWDFVVEEMAGAQIGVGFMLLWNVGPDWGFFGYLGSSTTAWAYDLSTGDVVCNTESIQGGLPKSADGRRGVVSINLNVPPRSEGSARFLVDGVHSQHIPLPEGAVVLPAACLLRESQRVTLARSGD